MKLAAGRGTAMGRVGELLGAGAVLGVGLAVGRHPEFTPVVVGIVAAAFLLGSALARSVLVIFGGLAVFQSSGDLTAVKLVYLAGVALAGGVATVQTWGSLAPAGNADWRPTIRWAAGFGAYTLLLVCLSGYRGLSGTAAVRDAAPYLLFALTPFLAIDLAAAVPARVSRRLLVAAGLTSAVGFTVAWLTRRGLAALPVAWVAMPSFMLPAALFSYACAAAILGQRQRLLWTATAAGVLSLVLVTATRSALLYLIAPVGILVFNPARRVTHGRGRLIAYAVLGAGAVLMFFRVMVGLVEGELARTLERLASIGTFVGNPLADQSFFERVVQSALAWRLFTQSPVLGAGLGHPFEWTTLAGELRTGFNVDTSISIPAKFGLVGLVLLAGTLWSLVGAIRKQFGRGEAVATAALVGYLTVAGAWLALASPFEDKGFSFGLMLLLAMFARSGARPSAVGDGRSSTTAAGERDAGRLRRE